MFKNGITISAPNFFLIYEEVSFKGKKKKDKT